MCVDGLPGGPSGKVFYRNNPAQFVEPPKFRRITTTTPSRWPLRGYALFIIVDFMPPRRNPMRHRHTWVPSVNTRCPSCNAALDHEERITKLEAK